MPFHKTYSSDIGLDCVHVLQEQDGKLSGRFGCRGKGDLEFRDPNSLVVDDVGNMIVSDGLNYKLKVVSKEKEYLGLVKVKLSCDENNLTLYNVCV